LVQTAEEGPRARSGGETMRQEALNRLDWKITLMRADLVRAARFLNQGAMILDELAGVSFSRW
jgi:hypothetical protein